MGILLAFFTGWALGARGGTKGYDEVLTAGKDVLRSEEFAALRAALRSHTEYALRQLADLLQEPSAESGEGEDVLSKVRRLVQSNERNGG